MHATIHAELLEMPSEDFKLLLTMDVVDDHSGREKKEN